MMRSSVSVIARIGSLTVMLSMLLLLSRMPLLVNGARMSPADTEAALDASRASAMPPLGSGANPVPYVRYWHNWASADGVSHFALCDLTSGWIPFHFGPNQTDIYLNKWQNGTTGLTWFYTPKGWNPPEFHANPIVQFGVWITSQMKFQAGDGTIVYINPGDLYLGDDVGSLGHHSMNTGYGDAVSAMIQFEPGTTGHGPCWLS